jgi:hypothetical protein
MLFVAAGLQQYKGGFLWLCTAARCNKEQHLCIPPSSPAIFARAYIGILIPI